MENTDKILWQYTSDDGLLFIHHTLNYQNDDNQHYYCRPSIHEDQFEIHFLKKGTVTYYIEGRKYNLPPYSVFCVPKGHIHSVRADLSQESYDRFVLQFSENILPNHISIINALYKNLSHSNNPIFWIFGKSIVEKYGLDNFFYNIESWNFKEDKYFYPSLIASTIHFLVDINKIIETEALSPPPVATHPIIQKILDYIQDHIEDNMSIKTIAKNLYLSEGYLSHLFHKHMGISLKKYIDIKKIRLAATLISNGHNPTAVAARLGYTNYSTFYHRYLQIVQVKPSTKRKSYHSDYSPL